MASWPHGLMGELHVRPVLRMRARTCPWIPAGSIGSFRSFSQTSYKVNQFNFFNKLNFYFAIHGGMAPRVVLLLHDISGSEVGHTNTMLP
jgi:hypothetical protein